MSRGASGSRVERAGGGGRWTVRTSEQGTDDDNAGVTELLALPDQTSNGVGAYVRLAVEHLAAVRDPSELRVQDRTERLRVSSCQRLGPALGGPHQLLDVVHGSHPAAPESTPTSRLRRDTSRFRGARAACSPGRG